MENIVNNPAPQEAVQVKGGNEGTGFLIGALILIVFAGVLLYFAIPAFKNMGPLQVNVPAPDVKVVVPDTVKVTTTPTVPTTTTP